MQKNLECLRLSFNGRKCLGDPVFVVGNVDRGIGRYSGRHSGRQSVDTRSTVGRYSVDNRSIVGRQSVDTRSTVGRQSVDIAVDSRSTVCR